MLIRLFAACAAMLALVCSAHATVRITNDRGGLIRPYLDRYTAIARSGERVVIDGPCISACTLLFGVPRANVCVTSRASFGVHMVAIRTPRGLLPDRVATAQMVNGFYPPYLRAWIKKHGGLTPRVKYVRGAELRHLFAPCAG